MREHIYNQILYLVLQFVELHWGGNNILWYRDNFPTNPAIFLAIKPWKYLRYFLEAAIFREVLISIILIPNSELRPLL